MTSSEMVDWIFDDNKKADTDYRGIVAEPFTRRQDVASQLQELRVKGLLKGDSRIDSFLTTYGTDTAIEEVEPQIDTNNDTWVDTFEESINKGEDADFLRDKLDNEKGSYEQESVDRVDNVIKAAEAKEEPEEPEAEPPSEWRPSQAEAIADVLGWEEEDVRETGVRAVQQALEGELFGRVQIATTDEELDDILADINSLPTKAGASRIKRDIKDKRKEFIAEE